MIGPSEISKGLWVGGKESIIPWKNSRPKGVVFGCINNADCHHTFVFEDDWLGGMNAKEKEVALSCAAAAFRLWRDTEILLACREGRNRSGLIAAILLVWSGLSPEAAINLVREKRQLLQGIALTNPYFVALIETGVPPRP